MSIKIIEGDMVASVTTGFAIHGCNAQGSMGSGIAKTIRDVHPNVYKAYRDVYEERGLKMGEIITEPVNDHCVYVNAITQEFYKGHRNAPVDARRFASYDAIEEAFWRLNNLVRSTDGIITPTVHFPMIGAGLGGADWDIISKIIDKTVVDAEKVLWVYNPK